MNTALVNIDNPAIECDRPEADVKVLEVIFNRLFRNREQTVLCSGAEEPFYQPAINDHAVNIIYSTRDYFSSALHEISHWCIAGKQRRTLPDYGYWYEPDGRTAAQQALFEQVEVKPQALEWLFTLACKQPFRLSVDNVNQPEITASEAFRRSVHAHAVVYLEEAMPERAETFLNALLRYYQPEQACLSISWLDLDQLK
jgi:elongation factor P hydroxylase